MKLLNYRNDAIEVKLPDLDQYDNILVTIAVIYGDEHITVEDGSGELIFGASSDHAIWPGGYDGEYVVYERNGDHVNIDLINDPVWQTRKDSYEFLYAAMNAAFETAGLMDKEVRNGKQA